MEKHLLIADNEFFVPMVHLNLVQMNYLKAYGFRLVEKVHYSHSENGFFKEFPTWEEKEAFQEVFDEIY